MSEYVQDIAKMLNTDVNTVGKFAENILVNNDIWKREFRLADDMPDDYPYGWCDRDTWEAFCDRHPGEYWFRWEEMLVENLDAYIEYDAVKLKER